MEFYYEQKLTKMFKNSQNHKLLKLEGSILKRSNHVWVGVGCILAVPLIKADYLSSPGPQVL